MRTRTACRPLKCSHRGRKAYNAKAMGDEVASASSHYRWEVSGKAVAVSLSLDVVERLELAVRPVGESLSPRRSEIGGFLFGTVKRAQGLTIVEVSAFELVECEHAFGASYFLSGEDQRRLATWLRRRKPVGGASIVGFFRSNTRKEFELVVEDVDLMATYFSKPKMVMLLVDNPREGPLRGGFFIWEQRAIRTIKPYLEFPFDASVLTAGRHEICRRASAGAGEKRRAPIVRRWSQSGLRWASLRRATTAWLRWPERLTTTFHLVAAQVQVHAGSMQVVRPRRIFSQLWPLLRGRSKVEWSLAAAVLAIASLGGILHRVPRLADASPGIIRMQPNGSADRVQNAVRLGTVAVAATAVPFEPMREMARTPTVLAQSPANSREARSKTVRQRAQAASRAAVFRIPPEVAEVASVPPLPAPPNVGVGLPESREPLVNEGGILPPAPPDVQDPFVTFAVKPVAHDRRALVSKVFPHGNVQRGIAFVPPRLIQQYAPEVSSELRRRIQNKTVPITVKLYLGRSGTVEYAELLSDGTGANRDLASLAVFASRKFQFSPAQKGGEAVPAEVLVRFRFGALANR